jgi:DNA-binding MarR family transcriptional regulator
VAVPAQSFDARIVPHAPIVASAGNSYNIAVSTIQTKPVPSFARDNSPQMQAFVRLLRAHQAITRRLSAELLRTHGLTLMDYEVLLHLSFEDERKLRRVDLAERVLLTASGITRLLDGLEQAGYVTKSNCASDARVTYAVLTETGLEKLRDAAGAHVAGVNELLGERLDGEQVGQLAELLGQIPGVDPNVPLCSPG